MNGLVLFLILHICIGTRDTNSSKQDTELKGRYPIDHKTFQDQLFCSSHLFNEVKTIFVHLQP